MGQNNLKITPEPSAVPQAALVSHVFDLLKHHFPMPKGADLTYQTFASNIAFLVYNSGTRLHDLGRLSIVVTEVERDGPGVQNTKRHRVAIVASQAPGSIDIDMEVHTGNDNIAATFNAVPERVNYLMNLTLDGIKSTHFLIGMSKLGRSIT